jgi:hypothetical protein
MNKDIQKFEKLSFWKLLGTRGVEIPIIQRDYAQGRARKEKVRNDFLNALKQALAGNPVELDFIYGSENNNILQPLDGQQRLTTLFLLYWFIANKEGKLEEAKGRLSKFTYETRTSSREFCKELSNSNIEINDVKVSEAIKDQSWFVDFWQKDPTISAMLTMLDAIQDKFSDTSGLWNKLTDEQNLPIAFLYIELENFGLSDDLYIKMNARGKQLTSFENFKASFERYIEEEDSEKGKDRWEKGLRINDTDSEEAKKEKLSKQFKNRIDSVWTDLFWRYRKQIIQSDKENTPVEYRIDDSLINFIAGTAINCYALNLEIRPDASDESKVKEDLSEKGKKAVTDGAVKRERIERRITCLANDPSEVTPDDFPTEASFNYLKSCLDRYAERTDVEFLNAELTAGVPLWHCEHSLFKDFIQYNGPKWQERTLFYGQTAYLLNNLELNEANFSDWMRVVRNIVENSAITAASPFIGAIGLINELSKGSNAIYDYLSKNKIQSGFANEQVKEEVEKSKIIVVNPNAKQIIHSTEDTEFCRGRIDFALYCVDYDIDKGPSPASFDGKRLEEVYKVIENNFADMRSLLPDEFKRAFITIGNNNYYEVWQSWSYVFDCYKRWLLRDNNNVKAEFAMDKTWKREYLKALFNLLTQKTLRQIIEEYDIPSGMSNWKRRIIKEDGLLKGATYILISDDDSYCLLSDQPRPSRCDQVTKIE